MREEKSLDIIISENLQFYRNQAHLTQAELAEKMNKAPSTMSQTFKQDNITLENLNDICKALDYDLEINLIGKEQK